MVIGQMILSLFVMAVAVSRLMRAMQLWLDEFEKMIIPFFEDRVKTRRMNRPLMDFDSKSGE